MIPTLKARLGEVVAIFCAVAVGAALVTACAVLAETGFRSHLPASRLAGADVVVSGVQHVAQDEDLDVPLPDRVPVDERLVDRVRAVPGVAEATGDVSFTAALMAAGQEPGSARSSLGEGHPWSPNLLLDSHFRGHAPQGDNDVAVTESTAERLGVRPGDRIDAVLAGRRTSLTITAVVAAPGGDAYVTPSIAHRLARPGVVDLIALRATPGTDVAQLATRVRQALGGDLTVSTGDRIGDAENPAGAAGRGEMVTFAMSLGGVVVLLVAFLVAGAVSISVTNRSRELALLRAVGATPRQVRSMVARQATRVAIGALLVGAAGGYALSVPLQGVLGSSGLMSTELPLAWSPFPVLAAGALLLITTQVASRAASRGVSRRPATEAVRDTQIEPSAGGRWRTRVGLGLLAISGGAAVVPLIAHSEAALISAASGTLLAIVGLSLVGPALVTWTGSRLRRRLGSSASPSGWLALSNTTAYAVRTGGALSVLALAIALTVTQLYTQTTLSAVSSRDVAAANHASLTVTAGPVGGVTPEALADVRRSPGVGFAVPLVSSSVVWTSLEDGSPKAEAYPMTALGHDAEKVLDLDVSDGNLHNLRGDTVALDSSTAWSHGIDIGERVTLVLADGTRVRPLLVATYRRSFGFGKVVLSTDVLGERRSYDTVLVAGSSDRPADATAVRHSLAAHPGTMVDPGAGVPGLSGSGEDPGRWASLLVTLTLLGYVLLGVANRLVATTGRRRSEWATLRAIGATPAQVLSMVRAEVGLVCFGAAAAGALISLGPMTMISAGLVHQPWPQGPFWAVVLICAGVGGSAYAATLLPARRVLRSLEATQ
ncbi:FtsX-like permease family protein [Luteipulveratus mongoliensis]|uniref:ABC3 transporter permease C-terminal domain-containing protein n=1 Tax=Luteipulveratus mongoliensis TaxID=571913 RepID=A0A0K1JMS3_9MICO|nr:FtsX-like permease family protein [Luteipulveratus mongoliensis]AKU18019.1 hypothetical protein VV02_22725 [Luteipulveratus mongoliensis]